MKRVIAIFICDLDDVHQNHHIKQIYILSTKEIYYKSRDCDGEIRHYTSNISRFEYEFKVDIGQLMFDNNLTF